ncbi:hypothetical protein EVG20_g5341 [Dentipellis fragilis]|uniref:Uncharacterized protein n=1 Tax=Dentipellis fragilis TaxID=205917 RepID=A0A4Y9YTM7_9AGAM|nr:hypothetical protein EVG20_g5341 [Dentipellis fragilis]
MVAPISIPPTDAGVTFVAADLPPPAESTATSSSKTSTGSKILCSRNCFFLYWRAMPLELPESRPASERPPTQRELSQLISKMWRGVSPPSTAGASTAACRQSGPKRRKTSPISEAGSRGPSPPMSGASKQSSLGLPSNLLDRKQAVGKQLGMKQLGMQCGGPSKQRSKQKMHAGAVGTGPSTAASCEPAAAYGGLSAAFVQPQQAQAQPYEAWNSLQPNTFMLMCRQRVGSLWTPAKAQVIVLTVA